MILADGTIKEKELNKNSQGDDRELFLESVELPVFLA